jgi:SNF2 family DNA or RNA helicase
MDIDKLKEYYFENSIEKTRDRALNISPKLEILNVDGAEFTYKGSERKAYQININYTKGVVDSSCTCPYDLGGICKHRVAALLYLIKGLESGEIIFFGRDIKPKQIVQNHESLFLDSSIIDIPKISKEINLSRINYGYRTYKVTIDWVEEVQIKTTWADWYKTYNQTFVFDRESSVLSTTCSCAKKKICEHRLDALIDIDEKFGKDFFQENYLQRQIERRLKKFGFSITDDYQKAFEFTLTTKGVETKTKFNNIAIIPENPIEIIPNEGLLKTTALPYIPKNEDLFGLGFCVQIWNKRAELILPVRAKYNKNKTEFVSSFTQINYDTLYKQIQLFEEKGEQEIILKTLQINELTRTKTIENGYKELKKAILFFHDIVPQLKEKQIFKISARENLVKKNLTETKLEEKQVQLYFTVTESDFFYTIKAKIRIGDKPFSINSQKLNFGDLFIICDDVLYPLNNAEQSIYINHYKNHAETNYRKSDLKAFYNKIIKPLSEKFEIQTDIFKKDKTFVAEEVLEKHVYISDEGGEFIVFRLSVLYGNQLISVFSEELLINDVDENKIIFSERNKAFEDNFVEDFRALHPSFAEQEGVFFLYPEMLLENFWLVQATERMKEKGFKVFGANDLKSFKFNVNKPVISVGLKSDIDWFDMEIEIKFGNEKVNLKDLQKSFLKKSNYVELSDGSLGILPKEWMKKFANYFKLGEIKKNAVQISNFQFGIIDELYLEMETRPDFLVEMYEKKKRLQNISQIEAIDFPKGVKAKLRDYQYDGLNWMAFLDKNQLGGCLADDMGLGKTLQTIVFLQYLKNKGLKTPPSLIIAPTSLIFNWQNEITKFCPSLKMLKFVGSNRFDHQKDFEKYDLVISTYGSLLNDIEFLQNFKFHYIILDESQAIKNPHSKRYKAVRLLKAYNRLVLTGTPIENNTFDLYSQFNFLNPGLLGTMKNFKDRFSDPIDKEKNEDSSNLLSRIISPFMLRRTKEQVVKELPDKTESFIYCEMSKEQRKVYETFKNKYRDYLLKKIEEEGVENSQMYILEGLTKLRQICNSTALIPDTEDYGNYSVKIDTLIENIKEKTGKHKILVFSQFVKMLQLIKTRLDDDNISYEYLDGQTQNRQDRVENFQNSADVRVFLISLKAGGTGLNLTEADYVFIVDPWWNPAVENQAIDRCYRIGQTKNVMAYRMICTDTIEEKIVELQQNKKSVAASVIQIDREKKSFDIGMVKNFFN